MVTDPYMHNAFSFSDSDPKYSAFCYIQPSPESRLRIVVAKFSAAESRKSKFFHELLLGQALEAEFEGRCDSAAL